MKVLLQSTPETHIFIVAVICCLGHPCSPPIPSPSAHSSVLPALQLLNPSKRSNLSGGTRSTCPLSPWIQRVESHLWATLPSGSPWTSPFSLYPCPTCCRTARAMVTKRLRAGPDKRQGSMEITRKTYQSKYSSRLLDSTLNIGDPQLELYRVQQTVLNI